MIVKIIVGCLIVLFVAVFLVLFWAYSTAFLKSRKPITDHDGIDTFLKEYRDVILNGQEYIASCESSRISTLSYDGLRLSAGYYPIGTDRTIIVCHGYRSPARRDYAGAVKMYHRMGLNVLMIDQRSHGDSEGKLITFGIKERRDVLSWVNFIIDNFGGKTEIFLSGISMGAATVMMAASLSLPENVKGIVADSGYSSPAEIIGKVARDSHHVSPKLAVTLLEPMCRLFGGFSLYETTAEKSVAETNIPLLFIHGKADDFVPYEMTVKCYEAARGQKDIVLVENAGHGCAYLVDTEAVEQKLKEFLCG